MPAYKEVVPSPAPEASRETIASTYSSMRQELVEKLDSSVAHLRQYADYFQSKVESTKGKDKEKWTSLEIQTRQMITQLLQLKKNELPPEKPRDYDAAATQLLNVAITLNRTLSAGYVTAWKDADFFPKFETISDM